MEFFNLITKKNIVDSVFDKYIEMKKKENKSDNHDKSDKKKVLTKSDVTYILDAFVDKIKDEVASGEKVSIPKFGNFEVVERAARECRNPQTGERMQIAACYSPKFKPAKDFKDCVNQR